MFKNFLNILLLQIKKANKGIWRMPWILEAMKDVISCDKPRVAAHRLLSVDFRMGQPIQLKTGYPFEEANPGN